MKSIGGGIFAEGLTNVAASLLGGYGHGPRAASASRHIDDPAHFPARSSPSSIMLWWTGMGNPHTLGTRTSQKHPE